MFSAARNGALAAILCMAGNTAAWALDFEALYMLQVTLNDHGFDAGDPDGRMGGKTRAAIEEFAAAYGGPTDPDELIRFIIQLNARHAEAITDAETLELIRIGVGQDLRDPESAQVRNVRRVTNHDGKTFLCGEVNGKNAYGAYAGFISFSTATDNMRFMGTETGYNALGYLIDTETYFSFWRCLLSFPSSHAPLTD